MKENAESIHGVHDFSHEMKEIIDEMREVGSEIKHP